MTELAELSGRVIVKASNTVNLVYVCGDGLVEVCRVQMAVVKVQ